jgi:heat shock protein HslJ
VKTLILLLFFAGIISTCGVQKETSLASGEWKLKSLFDHDVSQLKNPVTLKLDMAEKSASGFAGCNKYFSSFSAASSSIKFTEIGSTKMFCEKTMATEIKFTTALEQVDSFELRNNTLLLLADNKVILEFIQ